MLMVTSCADLAMTGDPVEVASQTLPDLLREGLDIVFVGINPSIFSVQRGHYFARKTNRFWPCLSRSIASRSAREALSVEQLGPEHDAALLDHGIGFTDLVKRATPKASDLAPSEMAAGVQDLLAKLDRYQPRIACFHGVTGYRHVHRLLTGTAADVGLGLQDLRVGPTRLYLVPNPSGANAHFTREDQTGWYDRLAECLGMPTELSEHP
jgi:TDG/mug DNA glycosylase family protein